MDLWKLWFRNLRISIPENGRKYKLVWLVNRGIRRQDPDFQPILCAWADQGKRKKYHGISSNLDNDTIIF